MTSHSRHSVTPVTPQALYHPDQVAAMLGRSEWWVREQARKTRIPYCRVGNSYRFTAEHLAEIVRLLEVRPQVSPPPVAVDPQPARSACPVGPERASAPQTRLKARPPRRRLRELQTAAVA
ncbi:helix-turn-helix domain-containing protein [Kitasatospora sp. NPDC001660]